MMVANGDWLIKFDFKIDDQQIIFQNGEIITPSRRRKKVFFELINL